MELKVDPRRKSLNFPPTECGIPVRALHNGKWGSHDITLLDEASLLTWLKSRDGDNMLAENVVGLLLGHGNLHPVEPPNPDRFTWNKPNGYNRKAIEAFLREADKQASVQGAMSGETNVCIARKAVIAWLESLLDKTPSEMCKG